MSVARRRFRIIKEIAEGGFGKVYLAEQISTDGFSRIVAVKLLHPKWSTHDEVVMRTRDEARLLGLIRHQHIVKVEDLTSIDGKAAIVMEYLEGVDLKGMAAFLKERGEVFPRAALFECVLAVASALDAAYNGTPLQGGGALRVIHRDIKPSNIFVTTAGGVKVLDFGTARANFAEREAKTQALAFGSQGYMAPERMLGEEDTPAADVFSLGVSLYELLALEGFGRIPPRPNRFAQKVEERVAAVPLEGDPAWCERVRATLLQMLAYDPDDRPTAAQVVDIMEQLAADAGDMGLRRFCRTWVAEAKASMPELDTGDPLAGQVVEEDASTSFASGDASAGAPIAPAPVTQGVSGPIPTGGAVPVGVSGPVEVSGPVTPDVSGAAEPPAAPASGGLGTRTLVAVVAGLLLLGGVAAAAVGVGLVLVLKGGGDDPSAHRPEVEPVPLHAPEVGSTGAGPTESGSSVGGRIVTPDARADLPRVPTRLELRDLPGAKVTIKGGGGFHAEWEGTSVFDVGGLADGRYSTVVELPDGKKVRGRAFVVDATQKGCAFTFDPAAEDWTGGCR